MKNIVSILGLSLASLGAFGQDSIQKYPRLMFEVKDDDGNNKADNFIVWTEDKYSVWTYNYVDTNNNPWIDSVALQVYEKELNELRTSIIPRRNIGMKEHKAFLDYMKTLEIGREYILGERGTFKEKMEDYVE